MNRHNLIQDLTLKIDHLRSFSYRSRTDSFPRATLRNPDSRSSISRSQQHEVTRLAPSSVQAAV